MPSWRHTTPVSSNGCGSPGRTSQSCRPRADTRPDRMHHLPVRTAFSGVTNVSRERHTHSLHRSLERDERAFVLAEHTVRAIGYASNLMMRELDETAAGGPIGARLAAWRLRRGLTRDDLASRTGLELDYVAGLETGATRTHSRSPQLTSAQQTGSSSQPRDQDPLSACQRPRGPRPGPALALRSS
ncbi:helix-turn-helix domain-containing protein [Streptomyces sp. NPDC018000]|uniref:helix-turn-helix domain-containing protein n=1 Tax=Streptomyces sp. NPDC018000 TaxID=3365028 RepID=UPI0037ABDAB9